MEGSHEEGAVTLLETALEKTEDGEARFHIRQAIQHLGGGEDDREP